MASQRLTPMEASAVTDRATNERDALALSARIQTDIATVIAGWQRLHGDGPIFNQRIVVHALLEMSGAKLIDLLTTDDDPTSTARWCKVQIAALHAHVAPFVHTTDTPPTTRPN